MILANGEVLHGDVLVAADLCFTRGVITEAPGPGARTFDARGLLVLPGIVDVHGDAFERQLMPRPKVGFSDTIGLAETDRQLAANGITTALHAITCSWEPGLRGIGRVRSLFAALEALKSSLSVDTRVHLRHEVFNIADEAEVISWLSAGRVHVLAFNDHMHSIALQRHRIDKIATAIDRAGIDQTAYFALVDRIHAQADQVPASVARIAAAARSAGTIMFSHDDRHPEERSAYRALGCQVAEFPMTEVTAEAAIDATDWTVFGAPNVLRGGSHTNCPSAAEMVGKGLCTVLASDYYYPSLAAAPFRLANDGVLPLGEAWALVAENAAASVGLDDRGQLNPGMRADVVLIEQRPDPLPPAIVATIVGGRMVHCTDISRLH